MTDETQRIGRYFRSVGGWRLKCGHCRQYFDVEGGDMDGTPCHQRYVCPHCNGMNYVSWDAKFDPRLIRSKPRVDLFGGWLQAGALLYRLTDGLIPFNRDEISVTMAEGSRDRRALAARAAQLREIFNGVVWPEPRE